MLRYFIWLLAVIGLIIILIILIIPGGKKVGVPRVLDSYASTNAVAKLTINGPITAEINYQSLSISVEQNQVIYQEYAGYNNKVIQTIAFPSNESAYYNFLRAIDIAGFNKGNTNPDAQNSVGYCAFGQRYLLQLTQNGNNIINFWSTNCGSLGTFGGDLGFTMALFQAQVPEYSKLSGTLTNLQ